MKEVVLKGSQEDLRPSRRGKRQPRKQQRVNALTRGEVRNIYRYLQGVQVDSSSVTGTMAAEASRFLVCTGLRLAEFLGLKKADIFVDKSARPYIMVIGKGQVTRKVPLSREAQGAAETLRTLSTGSHVFPGGEKYRRTIQRRFKNAGVACRVQFAVTPHVFRHTFASQLVSRGIQLSVVMDLLGHTDIRTTKIYLTSSFDQLKKAMDGLGNAIFRG